jgi:hypothetical protein
MSDVQTRARWLSLVEVADLLHLDGTRANRRRAVRRLFRRLELRDNAVYLHKRGEHTSGLFVSVDALSALDPHDPSTIQAIREDLNKALERAHRLEKRLKAVEAWAERASDYISRIGPQLSQIGPTKGGGSV